MLFAVSFQIEVLILMNKEKASRQQKEMNIEELKKQLVKQLDKISVKDIKFPEISHFGADDSGKIRYEQNYFTYVTKGEKMHFTV